jgi:hypothetical protein
MSDETTSDFERIARTQESGSFFGEFWQFLRYNKKWWLLPILVLLALFGLLVFAAGTGVAPFIYTLF